MALKPCTECGNAVSDRAKQCPNCGSLVDAGTTTKAMPSAPANSGEPHPLSPPSPPPPPLPSAPPPLPRATSVPAEQAAAASPPPLLQRTAQPELLRRSPKTSGSGPVIAVGAIVVVLALVAFSGYRYRAELTNLVHTRTAESQAPTAPEAASTLSTLPTQEQTNAQASPADAEAAAAAAAQTSADAAAAAADEAADDAAAATNATTAPDAATFPDAASSTTSQNQGPDEAVDAAGQLADAAPRDAQSTAQRRVNDAVRQMLEEGDACYARQEYGCAATNASNVLRLKPDDETALALKARAEAAQNQAMDSIDIH